MDDAQTAMSTEEKTFFGHPRGLSTLFFTELWERFSYYGMRALLVLFMTAAVAEHGLGMNEETATAIYGLYTFAVYALALPGGWIADRLIGQRKAVLYGGFIIAAGHYTMAVPMDLTFFGGLILVAVGTGLLKPNVSAVVADLYPEGGARRDAGFSIFYMGINFGALFGPLVCSTLGENVSWHLGFAAAGIGMTLALIQYLMGLKYMGDAGILRLESESAIQDHARAWKQFFAGLVLVSVILTALIWLVSSGRQGELSVKVSEVPSGAILSTGVDNGDGSWTLKPTELKNLKITPPENTTKDFQLPVEFTWTDSENNTEVENEKVDVKVKEETDGALPLPIKVKAKIVTFAEHTGEICAGLILAYFFYIIFFACRDSSEKKKVGLIAILIIGAAIFWSGFEQAGSSMTLFAKDQTERTYFEIDGQIQNIKVTGVPTGATLTAGERNTDGSWTLRAEDLEDLKIKIPDTFTEKELDLSVTISATDSKGEQVTEEKTVSLKNKAKTPDDDTSEDEEEGLALDIFSGWRMPVGWLQSINPLFIILLAPVLGALWIRMGSRNPSLGIKFGMGFILLGAGFLVVAWGASFTNGGDKVSPMWLVVTYFFHTVGELCLSPVGLSSITKLSPKRLVSQMMGMWFMGAALGNLIAGLIAGHGADGAEGDNMFFQVAIFTIAVGFVFILLFRLIKYLACGVK